MLVLTLVDIDLSVHKEFIGLYAVSTIEASSLVFVIKDSLLRLNLTLAKACGQCYDRASNRAGSRNGVAKQIQDEPRAHFIRCFGHFLNLAAGDTIKRCKTMKRALETAHEIAKLIEYSPRREGLFHDLHKEIGQPGSCGIRTLCPTRWTVRADSMQSIIQNYSILHEVWEHATEIVHDTETIARIQGVASQMHSFNFFFGLLLADSLLRHTDNLSRTL